LIQQPSLQNIVSWKGQRKSEHDYTTKYVKRPTKIYINIEKEKLIMFHLFGVFTDRVIFFNNTIKGIVIVSEPYSGNTKP
jgi:hypothetical protein